MSNYLSEDLLYTDISFLLLKLEPLQEPWGFTGSVGQVIQGMDLQPHDIDIQTTKEGAYAINELLQQICTEQVYYKKSQTITSYYGTFSYNNTKIEVMGDLKKLVGSEWVPTPDLKSIIKVCQWKKLKIPVFDLMYEMRAYKQMNRLERAEKIKLFLEIEKE